MSASHPHASAIRALSSELKSLKDEPLEGFRVGLVNDENLFDWEIAIFGAPSTIYEGGYFKARMHFPTDYPYSPPSLRFQKPTLFHPNVYESGELCISILHPPIDDPQSGELPCERWNPTQNVRTILLSVISLLNEPNTSSPANVDASVMFRRWKDSKGTDNEYAEVVKMQVAQSRLEAQKDGVTVPMTLEEYVIKPGPSHTKSSIDIDMYDDDDDYDIDIGDSDTVSSLNDSQLAASEEPHHQEEVAAATTAGVESAEVTEGEAKTDELQPCESPYSIQIEQNDPTSCNTPASQYSYQFKFTLEYPENEIGEPKIELDLF